jgi:hypothetical protein
VRAAAALLATVILVAGCSDSGKSDDGGEGAPSPSAVDAESAEGSPAACEDLADDDDLRGLQATMREAASGGSSVDIGHASEALRSVVDEFATAGAAADALDAWASAPDEPSTIDALVSSFEALDQEVQEVCEFPLS